MVPIMPFNPVSAGHLNALSTAARLLNCSRGVCGSDSHKHTHCTPFVCEETY